MRKLSGVFVLGAALVLSTGAQAAMWLFDGPIDADQSSSTVPDPYYGGGWIHAELDTDTGLFGWAVSFGGLTGPATAAHIHRGARGATGGIAIDLDGGGLSGVGYKGGAFIGDTILDVADVMELTGDGGLGVGDDTPWYINIHTNANGAGRNSRSVSRNHDRSGTGSVTRSCLVDDRRARRADSVRSHSVRHPTVEQQKPRESRGVFLCAVTPIGYVCVCVTGIGDRLRVVVMNVITRFPPSPTGDLHVGSARTALFNWLYARRHGGKFILRIEDTDRARSTQHAVDVILEGMAWLGLDYDDGPYYQSQRSERYRAAVTQLLDTGQAYYCNCSKERLESLRKEQMAAKQKPRYDGRCRALDIQASSDKPAVVRFKTPAAGGVAIDDQVHGYINVRNEELDDLVIARADGTATYHLSVVVDDIDMGVTHVIRGDDHINNTPRQVHICEALGATRPVYAHVPMINGSDGKKLSKRHGAVSVLEYRDRGFLAEALLNYLARLGWASGDQEIFSRADLISLFNFAGLNKAAATFDIDKLTWLNQHYIQNVPSAELVPRARTFFSAVDIPMNDEPTIDALVAAQRTRAKTLVEMAEQSRIFFDPIERDEAAAKKHLRPVVGPALRILRDKFAGLDDWSGEILKSIIDETAASCEMKLGKLAQPLRVAVTGSAASPSIDVTLALLGKTRCLARLDEALEYIAVRAGSA